MTDPVQTVKGKACKHFTCLVAFGTLDAMKYFPTAIVTCLLVLSVRAGRYEDLTREAAKGPHLQTHAATFFGGPDAEGFTGVIVLPNRRILAIGNALGPVFPTSPLPPGVIGPDRHSGKRHVFAPGGKGNRMPDFTPDMAGFMVEYAPDLQRIHRVVRFGWGIATMQTVAASPDGRGVWIAGYAQDADALTRALPQVAWQRQPPIPGGKPAKKLASVYLLRLDWDPLRDVPPVPRWGWILENFNAPPDTLWSDKQGNVYMAKNGLGRISADGKTFTLLDKRTGGADDKEGFRAVDPDGKGWYFGGDRNTHTGKEPWRQPYLYKFNERGEKEWTMWEVPSKSLRDGDGNEEGMVSDSAVRGLRIAKNGDLVVIGWSDGGNSIFTRQPTDVRSFAPPHSGTFTTWGMKGANSLAYLLRIDPVTKRQVSWSYFMCYVPETFAEARYRGGPNFADITRLETLGNNMVAIGGSAATGLISTPNAYYKHEGSGKYGGQFVAVLEPDFSKIRFSSYLPGYRSLFMAPLDDGLVVAGASNENDGSVEKPHAPPLVRPLQSSYGGGKFDAHLILLRP